MLKLNYGLNFKDLYESTERVDEAFIGYLHDESPELKDALIAARKLCLKGKECSNLIIALAPIFENFIASLFHIDKELQMLQLSHQDLSPLYTCKRLFVQRLVAKTYTVEMIGNIDDVVLQLKSQGLNPSDELAFAKAVLSWSESPNLEIAKQYAAWALLTAEGRKQHKHGVLFKLPSKLDYQSLVPNLVVEGGCKYFPAEFIKARDGFSLHEEPISLEYALNHANYCIFCHNQGKDSCSKGTSAKNSLGVDLSGCPLEEKISEMNTLKSQAVPIGALATAMIDNPMLAATGHRICNDCMRSCIYQKQDHVDIPAIESRILSDVLHLPWGFEIYSLLSRYNPLNFNNPLPRPLSQYKTMVVGMGPAGFTLAHYLLNNGVNVVAIDGLKIEPMDPSISGITLSGERVEFKPIQNVNILFEDLAERKAQGFGGVAEYGITVRWDKNHLKLIRLLLERRLHFRMYGGIRFGSNITTRDAFSQGFDHIAMAMGAGRPNLLKIPNILTGGVRTASDFLMTLQLSGANRYDSITNLTVELPVLVIGGGLTAIDTATESLAYYAVQVEKLLRRYEQVGPALLNNLSEPEKSAIAQQLDHAQQLRTGDKVELIRKWGGVKIVYRRTMQEAPCYRMNHEEVTKAMAEGIEFMENITPEMIATDAAGHCTGLVHADGVLPARTILIAIGTEPNTVIAREDDWEYELEGKYFKKQPADKTSVVHQKTPGQGISFFGDLHPEYAGNVVKAMASAKNGYPQVLDLLHLAPPKSKEEAATFFSKTDDSLLATVKEVVRLTHNIVEVIVHAPQAVRNFKPGQFYRLQNYECASSPSPLGMEGLALTGAWVNTEQSLLGMIVLEMGGSSNLCQLLTPGEHVVLMGPTGTPTEIPSNEKVMLVGGGLGNAVLFSIGKAMRDNGCEVLYFAGYKQLSDRYKIEEIQNAADEIIWCCDEGLLESYRSQDRSFHGNIVAAIADYGNKHANTLKKIDRMVVIGSNRMMQAVAYARHNQLKPLFKPGHIAIGSINSPMQCMMKEICGQCLQKHVDPKTGEENYVYSCFNQDQLLDCVDFNNLHLRLGQNSAQEKITANFLKANH